MPQSSSHFIVPSPQLRDHPPSGEEWVHEVKFDGYRVQLHKHQDAVTIYSRNGRDLTRRYLVIAQALHAFPARLAIIDGELVALEAQGGDWVKVKSSSWREANRDRGNLINNPAPATLINPVRYRERLAGHDARLCPMRAGQISGARLGLL